ncbi:hypothetical protein AVEN_203725-1 [Araneus ventricosus]|uniref:Uncharacterized protein n=1 Tax=Araneus ventricosus TaxID=182803 RepID=A0A4Y2IQT4_ARAVE|nr:hypothetical protein AVEN_203725-1 [Araneus ventricosus]
MGRYYSRIRLGLSLCHTVQQLRSILLQRWEVASQQCESYGWEGSFTGVWLYLRSVLKQHDGYFRTDLAILNHGQMTRTTPELAPPLQTSTPHQREDVWPLRMILRATGPIHVGSSVESGFESGALPPQSRNLTTRPPQPMNLVGSIFPRT